MANPQQGHPAPAAAQAAKPAAPPPPAWHALNWHYPFAPRQDYGDAGDPQTWLNALSQASGGFYPLGANGMFHGGVHFDESTGGSLRQTTGMRAIADGEVVAYRLNSKYLELDYPAVAGHASARHALYSGGFALLRHRLTLPPPAGGVLEFYSLYMHQMDWTGYQEGNHGQMPYWESQRHFRVEGKKSTDQQAPPIKPPASQPLPAKAPENPGHKHKHTHTPAAPAVHRAGGVFIYAQHGGNTQPIGLLPQGTEITVQGRATTGWGQIASIVSKDDDKKKGAAAGKDASKDKDKPPLAYVAGGTPNPQAAHGWVDLDKLHALAFDPACDAVVGLKTPYRVKAGDVVGYMGVNYLYRDASPMPVKRTDLPQHPKLHLEVFTATDMTAFLARSRAYAQTLHVSETSENVLLAISPGTRFVTDNPQADGEIALKAGQQITLAPGDPGDGYYWAKVKLQQQDQPHGKHQPKTPPLWHDAPGAPVWVVRDEMKGQQIHTWSKFPLQAANAKQAPTGFMQTYAHAYLAELSQSSSAADDQGHRWWKLWAGNATGEKKVYGWVTDTLPGVEWKSAWAWPGFEVTSSTLKPIDLFERNLSVLGSTLDDEEKQSFALTADAAAQTPLIRQIEQAISQLDPKNAGKVTAADLKQALGKPWLAQPLSHLVVRYESEWAGGMDKWEALGKRMGSGLALWKKEIERIEKLRWWDDVQRQVSGFPHDPNVWHIHPIGLVGNFLGNCSCINIDSFCDAYAPLHRKEFGWFNGDTHVALDRDYNEQSAQNLRALLVEMMHQYPLYFRKCHVPYLAYMLATARLESYTQDSYIFFSPVTETVKSREDTNKNMLEFWEIIYPMMVLTTEGVVWFN